MSNNADPRITSPGNDEVSLGELLLRVLRFYRRFGRLLCIPALIAALCAAAWIAGRPLYNVTALLEVPHITLEEWRQAQPFLWDERRVAKSFGDGDGTEAGQLRKLAQSPTFWTSTVQYRSALRRDDARDIPATEVQRTRGLGLEISLRVSNEEQAVQTVDALTHHIRQALLTNSVISLTRDSQSALASRPQLNLELIQTDFDIQQTRQRIADMHQVLERYPELRMLPPSTVVSVSDGGGRYLGPLPQIVALEAAVSELQAKSRKVHRDLERIDWTAKLLTDMDPTIRDAVSGQDLVGKLRDNRAKLLAAHPRLSSTAQEASEDISLKLGLAEARQQAIGVRSRSAVSTSPVIARNPKWVGLAVFCAAFGALSLLLVAHVSLRRDGAVLPWLPTRLRAWLLVDEQA